MFITSLIESALSLVGTPTPVPTHRIIIHQGAAPKSSYSAMIGILIGAALTVGAAIIAAIEIHYSGRASDQRRAAQQEEFAFADERAEEDAVG